MQTKPLHSSEDRSTPCLTVSQRVSILAGLHDHLQKNYIGWDYKNRRIGVNGDTIFSEAISLEKLIFTGASQLDRAQSNLNFFDRLHRLIAAFRDSHLIVRPLPSLPHVTSGLQLSPIQGRCFVSGVDERITRAAAHRFGQHCHVTVGDELLQVHNEQLSRAVARLMPFVSASSPESAWAKAARYLTRRNFNYPLAPHTTYRLRSGGDDKEYEATLEWHSCSEPERWDAQTVLSERGILSLDRCLADLDYEAAGSVGSHTRSVLATPDPILEQMTAYFRSDRCAELAMATGIWSHKGREYGVLRIYEMLEELFTETGKKSFKGEFSSFLKYIQRDRIPLLLDTRHNRGGSGELSMFVGSFFYSPNESRAPCSSTTLMNHMGQELSTLLRDSLSAIHNNASTLPNLLSRLESDIRSHNHGPLVARGPDLPVPDTRVFLFDLPAVLLISHDCGSAGDVLAWLLKNNERIALLGSKTEGAGFGFRRDTSSERPHFRDSLQTIHIDVPNQAWGRPSNGSDRCWDAYDDYWTRLVENVPVEPDVPYTPEDPGSIDSSAGWYRKATDSLHSPKSSSRRAEG